MERGFPVKKHWIAGLSVLAAAGAFLFVFLPRSRMSTIFPAAALAAAGIRRLMGAGTRPAGSAYRNSAKKRSQKPGAFTVSGGGSGSFGRFIGSVAIANCT